MKTDPDTVAELTQMMWELLTDVEANTDPDKDILRKRLVNDAYATLRRADAITDGTKPRWAR